MTDATRESLVDRIAIVGLGLIGSSVARAVRKNGLAGSVSGGDLSAEVCETALRLGFVDEAATDLGAAVEGADIVFICVPIGAFKAVGDVIARRLKAGAIVTDVGSVKRAVFTQLEPILPKGVHFIPGHPVAGTEFSGPEAGFAELFVNRWCILTPKSGTDGKALALLSNFWTGMGSKVEFMDADHHDLVLAITSHVPHLIAYNIVGTASDLEEVTRSEVIKYSAGGFRDFTRIAASDPTMWRDVFLYNKDAVLEMLGRFVEDLTALQRAIRWGDGEALFEHFARTRAIRKGIIEAGQETPQPDFGRPHGKT
jgi:cyclohexadieny/prephenate dehydrogenase